jgi:hypothetical protein
MGELLHHETRSQQRLDRRQLADRDHQVQIQADQRLHVRIDALTADHAIPHAALFQKRDQRFEEIGAVQSHGFPESLRPHVFPMVAPIAFAGRVGHARPLRV